MGNVLAVVEEWAAKQPEKALYIFLNQTGREIDRLTYRAFIERVELIAAHLRVGGCFTTGDRLLVAYPPGLEMICAFFGCVRAGLIPVPVPEPYGAALSRIRYVIHDCGAAGILTTAKTVVWAGNATEKPFGLTRVTWIGTDELSAGLTPAPRACSSEMLFLQYTSGSTSDPKGVVVSHDNVLANARLVLDHNDPVTISWLPQHHDMGLIGYYINTALGGGTLYGFSPSSFIQRPALWLETISRVRGTASSAPNFAFEHCLRPGLIPASVREGMNLSSLRFLMAAAEPIKPSVYRDFLQAFAPYGLRPESFVVAYGLAENTLAVSNYGRRTLSVSKTALAENRVRPTEAVSNVATSCHLMSCGRPLSGTEIRIVNPDSSRAAAQDEVGEIWIAGPSKCMGYWNKAEVSCNTFEVEVVGDVDPGRRYLRTGDMGFLHEGELYVCGRHKDMLIVRGQNHYPQDIEAVVEQVKGVRRGGVAVFEADGSNGTEIVILAEIARPPVTPEPRSIAETIRASLRLEVDRVVLVPPRSIPKTSSGKLIRFRARQLWQEGTFPVVNEYLREKPSAWEAEIHAERTVFGFFKAKYHLTGEEPHSLIDAGFQNSLDLVLFLHELSELLTVGGAGELADAVDIRLVQRMSVAELFRLAARFEKSPKTAVSQIRRVLALLDEQYRADELRTMAADRRLAFEPIHPSTAGEFGSPRKVLLTGATGFLGTFLLTSILAQTRADICCLVRGSDPIQARERLRSSLARASPRDPGFWRGYETRVEVACGDLDQPGLGLTEEVWGRLTRETDTIYHNGALVNYLYSYDRMRGHNVLGTSETLRLAFEGRPKSFNFLSTTFIFGWATKHVLYEKDTNEDMDLLDFGYSQSKWVAEQLVLDGMRRGLITRIFRPALITPAVNGDGCNFDITLRLLAFMVKYGIGVNALNQVSFMPADITAHNIVAISNLPQTAQGVFHVTRDEYANMTHVTDIITRLTGRHFELFDLPAFVPEVIRRCTPDDLLFPLLDFLVGSIDNISAMEFKRYDSLNYRRARAATPWAKPDPPLTDVVAGMLRFMHRTGVVDLPEDVLMSGLACSSNLV